MVIDSGPSGICTSIPSATRVSLALAHSLWSPCMIGFELIHTIQLNPARYSLVRFAQAAIIGLLPLVRANSSPSIEDILRIVLGFDFA
jgi:hypothetical protein